jgi:hypothetical protein
MFIRNDALSIPVIEVGVDLDKTSAIKEVLKGNKTMRELVESDEFRMFMRAIIGTAQSINNSGVRTFTYDAITVNMDHPYCDTAMFGIPHAVATSNISHTVQKRSGQQKTYNVAKRIIAGAIIECPLTMLLSACASRAQLLYMKEKGTLSAKSQAEYDDSLGKINAQIDRILADEPSIMLMGEQAVAVDNGDLYFHQPVMPGWMSVIESVEFENAPDSVRQSVIDYRARTVDIYKGISGVAGTLEEIEAQLDGYGVGSHLKNTPWLKLPNREAYEFNLTPEVKQFMIENGKYALGMFTNILAITYPNLSLNAVALGGVTADLVRKFKRLGLGTNFDIDSQDFGMIEVVERAFESRLKELGNDRLRAMSDFESLLDLKLKRLNFTLMEDLPDTVTRQDVYFYKKIFSTLRRTRAKWSVEHSNAVVLKTTAEGQEYLEITLPSGSIAKLKIIEGTHFDANSAHACRALSAPISPIVEEMVDFADLIENTFLYLVAGNVQRSDIFGDIETDTKIRIGGIYRTLADAVHHSIASPNPVIVIPVD